MQEIQLKTYSMRVHKFLPVFLEHSSRADVPFPAPRSQPKEDGELRLWLVHPGAVGGLLRPAHR